MSEEREQDVATTPRPDAPAAEVTASTETPRSGPRHGHRHERKRFDRGPRRGHDRDDGRKHHDRRPGRYRPTGKGGFERTEDDPRITALIRETEQKLAESIQPVQLADLNALERKQIHRYFDRLKPAFETKTYRGEGEAQVLWVFPIANLKKFAQDKAKEALETDAVVALPPMSSYERFIVHNVLKEIDSIEVLSAGEGAERHIEIQPQKFGRGLKKIIKKIKLM
ncbi:MAG: hypothetical protein ONB46_09425 [candidate division KSB1 bacterium]|nr:hypothetical protein [candidate division KSB1 bacterium]MDZ7366022.1 hypothetical protein [candidate division KSB1 bacterium]MDZ7404139.1 hypothetical protein [candidate division KSB1 bacterium]